MRGWEEGGDDVRSAWPFDALGNTRVTMDRYKGSPNREVELISKNYPQFGSESATRLREAGITSNRRSERYGEYVLGSCTHNKSAGQYMFLESSNLSL
jgi:hypothetical protein